MDRTSFHFHRMSDLICAQAIGGTSPPPLVLGQVFRESLRRLGQGIAPDRAGKAVSKARLAKAGVVANKLCELP